MREHFGVGVGGEISVAVANELIFERLVILNHAVMHEGQPAGRIEMGMRVLVGRFAVRGPAGVADAVGAGGRPFGHQFPQLGDPARAFPRLDLVTVDDRDAGGVVAAIFQAAQTIQKNGRCLRTSDVTDNPAHEGSVTLSGGRRNRCRGACAKRLQDWLGAWHNRLDRVN